MAYMIHITRNPALDEDGLAISLAAWIEAVNQIEPVRLAKGDYAITDPESGKVFTLHNNGGDADVLFAGAGWRRVFRWDDDSVHFVSVPDFVDPAGYLRAVARQLATALNAVMCGDGGEIYA